MESYKRGGHTVWDCKYHLVRVTKYRYGVLGGDVGARCRELLRETARAHEMVIHAGGVNRDHVHCYGRPKPGMSVMTAVHRSVPHC
jgi:putative transposase